jgi:hypothetical protein
LNNVVAVGLLRNVEGGREGGFLLRIDVWHVSSPCLLCCGFQVGRLYT